MRREPLSGSLPESPSLLREIHSFNHHGVTVPSESRNPAMPVEFDRKAKLLGNSGQLEAESQFRRKVRESQSQRKYDRKHVQE